MNFFQVKDVRDHQLENRQESFFLSETLKYLYLLFDEHNFLHAAASSSPSSGPASAASAGGDVPREQVVGTVIPLGVGARTCVVEAAGAYVFNTEAHPIDAGALACCSALAIDEDRELRAHSSALNALTLQLTGLPVLLPESRAPHTSTSSATPTADSSEHEEIVAVPMTISNSRNTLQEGRDVEQMLDDVNRVINVLEQNALPGDDDGDVAGAAFDLVADYMRFAMREEDEAEGGLQLRRFSRRLQSPLFSEIAEKRAQQRADLYKRHPYQVAAFGQAFVESKLADTGTGSGSDSSRRWPVASLLEQLCDECLVLRHSATADLMARASRGEEIDSAFNTLVRGVELCSSEQSAGNATATATASEPANSLPDVSRTCASLRRKPSPLLCPMRSFAASKLAFSGQVFSPETLS